MPDGLPIPSGNRWPRVNIPVTLDAFPIPGFVRANNRQEIEAIYVMVSRSSLVYDSLPLGKLTLFRCVETAIARLVTDVLLPMLSVPLNIA